MNKLGIAILSHRNSRATTRCNGRRLVFSSLLNLEREKPQLSGALGLHDGASLLVEIEREVKSAGAVCKRAYTDQIGSGG